MLMVNALCRIKKKTFERSHVMLLYERFYVWVKPADTVVTVGSPRPVFPFHFHNKNYCDLTPPPPCRCPRPRQWWSRKRCSTPAASPEWSGPRWRRRRRGAGRPRRARRPPGRSRCTSSWRRAAATWSPPCVSWPSCTLSSPSSASSATTVWRWALCCMLSSGVHPANQGAWTGMLMVLTAVSFWRSLKIILS